MPVKERGSNTGTHLKIKGDASAKHAREEIKSFVTIVSTVVQVTILHEMSQWCSQYTKSGKPEEATTTGQGVADHQVKRSHVLTVAGKEYP